MRQSRITIVRIVGSGNVGEDCVECIALKGKELEIKNFPGLPLPGCNQNCKCIVVAVG